MGKSKEMAEPAVTPQVSQSEMEQKQPEKKSGRELISRSLSSSNLPPPDGSPALARAGEMVARPGSTGASGRALMANSVQGALGNNRLGRMAGQAGSPARMPGGLGLASQAVGSMSALKGQTGHGMAPSSPSVPPGGRTAPVLKRQADSPHAPDSLPSSVDQAMRSSPGAPLSSGVRSKMEDSFGTDFGGVRVHTGDKAAQAAEDINATAFTHGQDIYFGQGRYQPGTSQGDKLLAHELTHTIQQGSSGGMQAKSAEGAVISQPGDADEQQAEKAAGQIASGEAVRPDQAKPENAHPVQRSLDTLLLAAGISYLAAVELGKHSVYELKGSETFEPNLFLQAYIFDSHDEALVNVRYGSLAKGKIYIRKDPSGDYLAGPSALPMTHPDIAPPGGGQSLSLVVWIDAGSAIHGKIGVTEPLPPNSIGAAYGSPEDEQRFLKLLTGHTTEHGKLKVLKLQNELDHGVINFWYIFQDELYVGTTVLGGFTFFDETLISSITLSTSGKGFPTSEKKLERDKTGDLFGKLEIKTDWEGKGFKGALRATFEDGILEIQGTLKYDSPRLKGEVNVLATEESRAWQTIEAQLAALKPEGGGTDSAPAAGGGAAPATGGAAAGDSRLALVGWGVLSLVVTDKINGDAAFVVDPDGYLTLRGTIRSPHKITLMDAKTTDEKVIFDEDYAEMIYVWWAVGVRAKAHVKLSASAVFGPLTLHDITLTGIYSTRPGAGSEIEISAKLNLSASAKAVLAAGGELSARLGHKRAYMGVNLASVDLNITTEAEVRGVVEATPTIKRQTKGSGSGDDTPKYIVGGELFVGGEIDLKLSGDLLFTAAGVEVHTIHLGDKVYPIAGFGVTTDVAYTLGSDEMPEVKYKKGAFEPGRFIRNIVQEKRPKESGPDVSGGFKEDGKEKGHIIPSDDVPPEPPQTPQTQVIQFSMNGADHTLFLILAGPGKPVSLEMASRRGPVRPKIIKAQEDLIDVKDDFLTDETTRKKIERRLDDLAQAFKDATRLLEAAEKLGIEPTATQMDVPGLKNLGDEFQTYADRYHVSDLGELPSDVAPPAAPGPAKDTEAEEVLASWTNLKKDQEVIDQVRRILNTGRIPQVQFRAVMDKTKINGAPGKRMLGYVEQLTIRSFSGIAVVFSDLEIGGNKFSGAVFMLRYIDENDLWGSVTSFETPREDRRIDAIIRRTEYEFKSWGEFRSGTFLDQVSKDYDRNGLKGVRWVLQKRELGDKTAVVQLMTDALNDKDLIKNYGISQAKAKRIIAELDRVVIVY